jgi:hypothetical protein
MPITSVDIEPGSLLALAAGKPWGVASNALRRRAPDGNGASFSKFRSVAWSITRNWTTGNWFTGANNRDDTDPAFAGNIAVNDGKLTDYTRANLSIAGTVNEVYLLIALDGSIPIDCCMIKFANGHLWDQRLYVTVRFSQNQTFSDFTDLPSSGVVASATMPATNAKLIFDRLIGPGGFGTWARYSGVQYVAIDFARTGLGPINVLPQISEVVLGQRRQFGHNPRRPHDPQSRRSTVERYIGDSGAVGTNVLMRDQAVLDLRFKAHPHNVFGIDERATAQALWDDAEGGTRPILWVNGQTKLVATGNLPAGVWTYAPEPEAQWPYTGPTASEINVQLLELPPFQRPTEDLNPYLHPIL